MPLSAVLPSGVPLDESGVAVRSDAGHAAAGRCSRGGPLGVRRDPGGAGATTPEAFWAAIADAFVAATVFALLALALVVFVVRSPRP
jgi:hypothetical protein